MPAFQRGILAMISKLEPVVPFKNLCNVKSIIPLNTSVKSVFSSCVKLYHFRFNYIKSLIKTILAGAPSTPLILSGNAHMKYSPSSISFSLTPSIIVIPLLKRIL